MRTYSVLLFQDPNDSEGWLGAVPALRGVHSQGRTRDEAFAMTTLALEGALELLFERGQIAPSDVTDLEQARSQTRADFGLFDAVFEIAEVHVQLVVTVTVSEPEVKSLATASR